MFTGIISAVGRVVVAEAAQRTIECPQGWLANTVIGDSIAVNGVCLTVTSLRDNQFSVALSPETLRCCVPLAAEKPVNLEHALAVGDKLSGHFVGGHVDGVAVLRTVTVADDDSRSWLLTPPPEVLPFIAVKGSVCLDGVSLTVNTVTNDGFTVTLIPHTLSHTCFADYRAETPVNVEADMLARHVQRLLSPSV